jgi:hypothetical protein
MHHRLSGLGHDSLNCIRAWQQAAFLQRWLCCSSNTSTDTTADSTVLLLGATAADSSTSSSKMVEKIKVANPVVDLDGDEMTR